MAPFLRLAPLVLAAAGSVLLVVSEFTTLTAVQIITVERGAITGGDHHLYALAVIGVAALPMAWGAVAGGSRPAAWALLALAVAALGVVLVKDLPKVSDEGIVAERFEQAVARPEIGFYLETLGAALLLVAAVATLLLRPGQAPAGERPAREPAGG